MSFIYATLYLGLKIVLFLSGITVVGYIFVRDTEWRKLGDIFNSFLTLFVICLITGFVGQVVTYLMHR